MGNYVKVAKTNELENSSAKLVEAEGQEFGFDSL